MNLTQLKYLSSAAIWLSTFIGCLLSLFIVELRWKSRIESLAGGVFLGSGLAHLLAEANTEFLHVKISYPIGYATCLLTFAAFTAIEYFSHSSDSHNTLVDVCTASEHIIVDDQVDDSPNIVADIIEQTQEENEPQRRRLLFGNSNSGFNVSTLSLYFIMDVHSLIEGIAMGILHKWSSSIALFSAILGHKPIEALALAVLIIKCKPTVAMFWSLTILYTVLTPMGILIGIWLDNLNDPIILGLTGALSSGTFLFVGNLQWSEMYSKRSVWPTSEKLWHYLLFVFGIVWMLLIAVIEIFSNEE